MRRWITRAWSPAPWGWDRDRGEADDAAKTIEEGEMPRRDYLRLHPAARLSAAEKRTLVDALHRLEGAGGDDRG